jgi:hypothetical protein
VTRLPMDEFVAFIGNDWADAKHDIGMQVMGSATKIPPSSATSSPNGRPSRPYNWRDALPWNASSATITCATLMSPPNASTPSRALRR